MIVPHSMNHSTPSVKAEVQEQPSSLHDAETVWMTSVEGKEHSHRNPILLDSKDAKCPTDDLEWKRAIHTQIEVRRRQSPIKFQTKNFENQAIVDVGFFQVGDIVESRHHSPSHSVHRHRIIKINPGCVEIRLLKDVLDTNTGQLLLKIGHVEMIRPLLLYNCHFRVFCK
jgi:hypothetical protein